ncbi:hypothetical protein [Halalkalibacter krulwichiae]|uniref:hypothetical protein n=1 Tax=Halalkalibacter krulwichiae TaxID=199441 RepID=UPI000ACF7EFF|nr:hypothetical protein [Halalkalibacter krulwichiae]
MKQRETFVFYTIKSAAISSFVMIDLVAGSGIYYALYFLSSSMIVAMAGSAVGIYGVKKLVVGRR